MTASWLSVVDWTYNMLCGKRGGKDLEKITKRYLHLFPKLHLLPVRPRKDIPLISIGSLPSVITKRWGSSSKLKGITDQKGLLMLWAASDLINPILSPGNGDWNSVNDVESQSKGGGVQGRPAGCWSTMVPSSIARQAAGDLRNVDVYWSRCLLYEILKCCFFDLFQDVLHI